MNASVVSGLIKYHEARLKRANLMCLDMIPAERCSGVKLEFA
jgi:hypothetical protein